jgi:hypothetical protein
MRDTGNLPASGYYDQLIELRSDLDSLRTVKQPVITVQAGENQANGLSMLIAASGSLVDPQMQRTNLPPGSPAYMEGMIPYVTNDLGNFLDDPSLADFLDPRFFDSMSGFPVEQAQYEWGNANYFGDNSYQ